MRRRILATLVPALGLVAGCTAPAYLSNADALASHSVEMALDDHGVPTEIEYHIDPSQVPQIVRAAMDALHPGGTTVEAEKEYLNGELYWELTKTFRARSIEAMFTPQGVLHQEEIEVAASDVPSTLREAVRARGVGRTTKWEEIRDDQRRLVEYHAKTVSDGVRYKVMVGLDGTITSVVREVQAEIEIPVH